MDARSDTTQSDNAKTDQGAVTAVIIGAGMSGLCAAIKLKQAGIDDFVILEMTDGVGGTWHDNSYPGSGCDVPSHLYSYSFEPKADWSRLFSLQPEILDYFEHCADKYGLTPHIRLNTAVAGARFDSVTGRWRVTTQAGEVIDARVLIAGCGQLNRPYVPDLPGLEDFEGTSFHSARWNHAHDLTGQRVAVIGNGASAVQFVPQIAPQVERLSIFQRSCNWIIPRKDKPYSGVSKRLFKWLPFLAWLHRSHIYCIMEMRFAGFRQGGWYAPILKRMATRHMKAQVPDPELRARLTPDYPVGCKRILISDDYYPAIQRDNVDIVTDPIDRITPTGVRMASGREVVADTLIFGTGFQSTGFLAPMEITGLNGRTLDAAWADGAEAYLGLTVAGFPNMFILYGPNSNLGHNSIIFMVERQVEYMVRCVKSLVDRDLLYLDVKADVMADYNSHVQQDLKRSVWDAGCGNWYKTDNGKITNNWPSWSVAYWWRLRHAGLKDFDAVART